MSNLATIMERRQISKTELSRRSGVSRPTIIKALRGEQLALESWMRIARALDCNVYELSPDAYSQVVGLS